MCRWLHINDLHVMGSRDSIAGVRPINQAEHSTDPKLTKSWTSGLGASLSDDAPTALGRYQLGGLLGQGGFGSVYSGYDPELKRPLAIKVPRCGQFTSEDAKESFLQEARKAAQLDHPHIVPVYDVGVQGDRCYIVYKFIDGQSLAERLTTGKLPHDQATMITVQVAEALGQAHRSNLYHRDIKPANILLDQSGRAHVADFGLAVNEADLGAERGRRSGTLAYMSPEMIRGQGHLIDGRSDIYSLGVMLYEMLCGSRPYEAKTAAALREQILHREPRPLRQVDSLIPPEVERICLKAMSKSIADRYATAGDMSADLRAWLSAGAGPVSNRTAAVVPLPSRDRWKYGLIGSLIAVVGLLVVGVTGNWFGLRQKANSLPSAPVTARGIGGDAQRETAIDIESVPSAATPRMLDFQVSYVRSGPDGDRRAGLLGRDVWRARRGDAVRLEAKFSQPVHAYLLALRADGQVDLCWPDDETLPPPAATVAVYPPPTTPNVMYGLDEGAGMWAFLVLASEDSLPAYQDWKQTHQLPPWTSTAGSEGVVWRLSAEGVDQLEATGESERGKGRVFHGEEPLEEIIRWSKVRADFDILEGVAFTAQPRD